MPSDIQLMERKNNISAIMRAIRINKKMTRRELMNQLKLSWGCISELIAILIDEGIIVETAIATPASRGRIPTALMFTDNKKVLGVDVNRVGISTCVCDFYGEKLLENTMMLDTTDGDSVLQSLFSAIEKARKDFPDIAVVGVAMQGIKEKASNIWRFPADKTAEIDSQRDIASKLDIPVIMEHDPNCMLLNCIGDSVDESKMLVRIDSGIGAALYKYNRFFDDSLLELGYLVVGDNRQTLSQLVNNSHSIENIGKHLGITLANISNMIALDEIILCGDFVRQETDLLPIVKQYYNKHVIDIVKSAITTANIPNAAFGAAKLAIEQFPYIRRKKEEQRNETNRKGDSCLSTSQ